MGRTQILFIVLSVIIVGFAVAMGITRFKQSTVELNRTALLLDCENIISAAQQWYRKPASLGGGGGSFDGLDSLGAIGVSTENENGTYQLDIAATGGDIIKVDGIGHERNQDGNFIQVSMTYNAASGVKTTDQGL